MRSVVMLMPKGSQGAALLVRRPGGEFAFERIDARVARATRAAARWFRDKAGDANRKDFEFLGIDVF
ncbi:MAG TPA: hypothetical protein VK437_13920 [Steroidobacteraceae bacterium]|nr:hypothetical protein [Steroidobacteraceae bacterium]